MKRTDNHFEIISLTLLIAIYTVLQNSSVREVEMAVSLSSVAYLICHIIIIV